MTRDEIYRNICVGSSKSACVDIRLILEYPGFVRSISFRDGNRVSVEGDDYGLLTKHIISGINQGAADANDDGLVSMDDLYQLGLFCKASSRSEFGNLIRVLPSFWRKKFGASPHLSQSPLC